MDSFNLYREAKEQYKKLAPKKRRIDSPLLVC